MTIMTTNVGANVGADTVDGEILRQVWDTQLPICVRLAAHELVTYQEPEPLYMLASRMSYFPLFADKLIRHFRRFILATAQSGADLWLEYNGIPLKSHLPIGLLWDLVSHTSSESEQSPPSLPWPITVHFSDFPEEEIVRCNSRAAVETLFKSAIKEADAFKHSGSVVNSFQKHESAQLWQGLVHGKFDQFWAINSRLMERVDGKPFRNIPFRLYCNMRSHSLQMNVKPIRESSSQSSSQSSPSETSQLTTLDHLLTTCDCTSRRVILHGIEVPLESPLQWLSEHLSYADNFLHLVVVNF